MISLEHIEVEEYPDSIGSDVRHFRVFDKQGEINRGFGSAHSSEMALYKAMSEYFERLTFARLRLGTSSNGFAAHIDDEKAKNAAACELIERDAVMCSWLCKRPPEWIDSALLPKKFEIFRQHGLECRVGRLAAIGKYNVFMSTLMPLEKSTFGMLFTSAASVDLSVIDSIYLNQRRNFTYFKTNLEAGTLSFPKVDEVLTPDDHRRYFLNPSVSNEYEWLFQEGSIFEYSTPNIRCSILKIPVLTPWPLSVARAESDELQDYFVGLPEKSKLNLVRISIYEKSKRSLNMLLHPLP